MKKNSASQLSTAELCIRKWALKNVFKCPEPKKGHHGFGTLLHKANERFLRSEPMWPEGWDYDEESKTKLTPAEAALMQVLVQSGIDAGYVEREPQGRVEHEDSMMLPEFDMEMLVRIDYLTPVKVVDHKHSKSVRYFKSKETLKTDIQMNVYGKYLIDELWRKKGLLPPPIITLTHNQFLKDFDNPETRQRSAEVTPREIDNFWDGKIIPLVKQQESARLVKSPFDLPDPPRGACNAFGGCPYQSICSGAEDIPTYQRRIGGSSPKPTIVMTSVSPNDFLSRRAAPAGSPAVNPPLPPAQAAPAAPTTPVTVPPWAWANCPMCSKKKTPGWSDKKAPCRICLSSTKIAMDSFEWEANGDGSVSWWRKGERVAETKTPAAAATGAKTAHVAPDFVQAIKAAKTTDDVTKVLETAKEALGEGADMALVLEVAEKRLDEIVDTVTTLSQKRHLELLQQFNGCSLPETCDKIVADAVAENASPEQLDEVNKAAAARKEWLKNQAAAKSPVPAAEPAAATQEPVEEPAKRGPGRPRKDGSPAQPKVVVEQVTLQTTPGLVLVIGADVSKWPGATVVTAEQVLNQIPGYWDTIEGGTYNSNAAFRRRDAVRSSAASMVEKLKGLVIVQKFRDPDCSNLMSSLMPHATTVVTGALL